MCDIKTGDMVIITNVTYYPASKCMAKHIGEKHIVESVRDNDSIYLFDLPYIWSKKNMKKYRKGLFNTENI